MLADGRDAKQRLATIAALVSAALSSFAGSVNTDYLTPPFTFSPDQRYGVMIPIFHMEAAQESDDRMNKVVEIHTGQVVGAIRAETGYDRALYFRETAPPRWSPDSSVLLWNVKGKRNLVAMVFVTD